MNKTEILLAVTILLISLFFVVGDIISLIGIKSSPFLPLFYKILSWIIFVFAILTAIILVKDARKE